LANWISFSTGEAKEVFREGLKSSPFYHRLRFADNRLDSFGFGDEQGCIVFGRAYMNRELALKIVLALVGMLFLALAYPLAMFMRQDPALSMMFRPGRSVTKNLSNG
jgi:hypothetical protein